MGNVESNVAVVLTCYNEGRYIGAAVRSVLDQTREDIVESIVIADDGSDDDTLAVLRQIEKWDPRIKVLYGAGGAGLPAQRNLAISATSAPLIAILDGDDYWTPNKLELTLPHLAGCPEIGMVYSGYFSFADGDATTAMQAKVTDITAEGDLMKSYFLDDPPIIPSTTIIRRSAFDACGRFDESIRVFEDTDFYLRMTDICLFFYVATPLLYKRSNKHGITGTRRDLMAHHAFVAFRAASKFPRLLPLVPRRLAERARKLGNHRFLMGDVDEARQLVRLALRLDWMNIRAWMSLMAMADLCAPLRRLFAARVNGRRLSLGAAEPLK